MPEVFAVRACAIRFAIMEIIALVVDRFSLPQKDAPLQEEKARSWADKAFLYVRAATVPCA